MIPGRRHLAAVLVWKPLAATAVATAALLTLVERPPPLLLSATAAAVAAATPFVLDDTAATTLQSSPTTLRHRRARRIALVVPLLTLWWVVAFIVVSRSTDHLDFAAYTLQFATLVGIGLAGAAIASSADNDGGRGGTIGAIAAVICFGTAFLPARPLQLVPADPAATGAARQLIATLIVAVALQLLGSDDPARRTTLWLRRTRRGIVVQRGKP